MFTGKDFEAHATIMKAKEDELEWSSRKEIKQAVDKKVTPEEPDQRWKPPPPTWIKCNTDGTWKKETGELGIGWVARYHQGNLMWAGARKLARGSSALETERGRRFKMGYSHSLRF